MSVSHWTAQILIDTISCLVKRFQELIKRSILDSHRRTDGGELATGKSPKQHGEKTHLVGRTRSAPATTRAAVSFDESGNIPQPGPESPQTVRERFLIWYSQCDSFSICNFRQNFEENEKGKRKGKEKVNGT